jgi:hypothetical protein
MSFEQLQVLTCKKRKLILGGRANVVQMFGRGKLRGKNIYFTYKLQTFIWIKLTMLCL